MLLWGVLGREASCLSLSFLIAIAVFEEVGTFDVLPQKELYTPDYRIYHSLSNISVEIQKIVKNNPKYLRYFNDYTSHSGHTQNVIQVSNFMAHQPEQKGKVKILFSYGEHAREFFPVESVLHLLHQLLSKEIKLKSLVERNQDSDLNILDLIDLYIVVTGNPDGRTYVEQSHNYCWRGTSNGVDINRNFDWEFGGKGSSGNKKDEEYRGPSAFSERETQVYKELTEKIQFDAFVSFHSGIRQIYIPYADTKSKQIRREPDNLSEMMQLAQLLSTVTGKRYQYGKAADLNDYTADGTVFDYMAGVRKIPFSYAIEMWGPDNYRGSSCFDLFNPTNEHLKATVEEVNRLYPAFFNYLIDWKRRRSKHLSNNHTHSNLNRPDLYVSQVDDDELRNNLHNEVPPVTPGLLLLLGLILICLLFCLNRKFSVFRRMYQRKRVVSLRSLGSSFAYNMFST